MAASNSSANCTSSLQGTGGVGGAQPRAVFFGESRFLEVGDESNQDVVVSSPLKPKTLSMWSSPAGRLSSGGSSPSNCDPSLADLERRLEHRIGAIVNEHIQRHTRTFDERLTRLEERGEAYDTMGASQSLVHRTEGQIETGSSFRQDITELWDAVRVEETKRLELEAELTKLLEDMQQLPRRFTTETDASKAKLLEDMRQLPLGTDSTDARANSPADKSLEQLEEGWLDSRGWMRLCDIHRNQQAKQFLAAKVDERWGKSNPEAVEASVHESLHECVELLGEPVEEFGPGKRRSQLPKRKVFKTEFDAGDVGAAQSAELDKWKAEEARHEARRKAELDASMRVSQEAEAFLRRQVLEEASTAQHSSHASAGTEEGDSTSTSATCAAVVDDIGKQALLPGDEVEVIETFSSNNKTSVQLQVGERGKVDRIGEGRRGNAEELREAAMYESESISTFHSLADLQDPRIYQTLGLNPQVREQYLSDDDFVAALGMSKGQFAQLPNWKRDTKKRAAQLF